MSTNAALARDRARAGRELLHRVGLLLSADRAVRDVLDQFAAIVASALGAISVSAAFAGEEPAEPEKSLAATVVLPIASGGAPIGTLTACWQRADAFDDYDVTLLESCALHLGARIADERQRLERERLEQLASTDALTGLANRRTFDETLAREWARCARSGAPLSVLLLDVDFFKAYNDTYGHIAGDGCLQKIARAVASCVKRPGDLACRYGGEEFVVVLPETSPSEALRVGEAICAAVRDARVPHHGSSLGYATVSVGCAGAVPERDGEPAGLTEAADAQLYRAKERGRNRVAATEYLSDAPVAERQIAPQHNLPASRTQFFGRSGDLEVMSALLRGCRVLTVAGPGGVGKTRLAIEYARRHAAGYADGVCFVELASLVDGAFVAPAILAALGLREESGRDPDLTLVEYLRDKRTLLVFDNCEHLGEPVAMLTERLLGACEGVAIVATSRHPLEVYGEQVYRVASFHEGDAVALFASRAQAVAPSFGLTPENLDTVKRICSQLDGIPLAIELAAARARTMSVEELDRQLRDRFRVLTGGSASAGRRQHTLYDTIEWSYNLLDEAERRMMRRLAIFAGSFTLESATEICGEPEVDVMDVLARLIGKSLLQFEPIDGRYWLLESSREFGRRHLAESGELEPLRARYARRLLALANDAEKRFGRGAGDGARADVASNYADFRSALEWALACEEDVALGAAIAAALGWYWTERGLWREGRFWLQIALRRSIEEIGVEPTARLRLGSAVAYYVQADFASMRAEAQRCAECYAALDDKTGLASAQNLLAIEAQFSGRLQEADDLWQSVLAASHHVRNARLEAVVLGNLAELATDWKSDFAESERLYERAAAIHRELTNSFPLAVTLGDWSATAAYQGDYRRAERLAREALETFRAIEEEMRVIEQLIRIGHYRLWAGRCDEARRPLREAFQPLRRCANPLYVARGAEAIAELALRSGKTRDAVVLSAFGEALRSKQSLVRPAPLQERVEAARADCRAVLGDAAYAEAWDEGLTIGDDEAMRVAEGVVGSKRGPR